MNPLDENNNLRYLGADKLTGIHVYEDKTTLERYFESNGKLVPLKEYNEDLLAANGHIFDAYIDLNEEPLTEEESKEALKYYQSICKHDKGYITNTIGPSKCALCRKPLY